MKIERIENNDNLVDDVVAKIVETASPTFTGKIKDTQPTTILSSRYAYVPSEEEIKEDVRIASKGVKAYHRPLSNIAFAGIEIQDNEFIYKYSIHVQHRAKQKEYKDLLE